MADRRAGEQRDLGTAAAAGKRAAGEVVRLPSSAAWVDADRLAGRVGADQSDGGAGIRREAAELRLSDRAGEFDGPIGDRDGPRAGIGPARAHRDDAAG